MNALTESYFYNDNSIKIDTQLLPALRYFVKLKELEERYNVYDSSLAFLVHEIKAPLATIKANVEMIESVINTSDKAVKSYSIINEEIKRVDKLLRSIFLFNHKLNLFYSSINFADFMNGIKKSFSQLLNNNGIKLNLNVENFKLQCDYNRLKISLVNIIENSIESICRRNEADISSKYINVSSKIIDNNIASILISDTGCGTEHEQNIFEPFFTTKSHGIGLGLTIANKIINLHDGNIELLESNPGAMTFEIKLPINTRL